MLRTGSSVCLLVGCAVAQAPPVDFDRDIRPLLADRCYKCHGPDAAARRGGRRLDTREGLLEVIDPGRPARSELWRRISATDEDRMPPAGSKLALAEHERERVRRWIASGAPHAGHWAFAELPRRVDAPAVARADRARNKIDRFVLAKLADRGLAPNPAATRERLIRRASLVLTGIPPTQDEIDAFLGDSAPGAYERLVRRLLASPRFGVRMASDWLDVARYADTYGYQADVYRAMWPWRDWVVRAFNANLPFDQFLTWQLAGDLLPDATRDQILATAFNRLHRQTNEGGSVEEEFRVEYVSDRVHTFGTAFLGLTLECARCHDHKFDPISQRDYYRLSAFFDRIDESGLYSHFTDAVPTPTLLLPTARQSAQRERIRRRLAQAERELAALSRSRRAAFRQWLEDPPAELASRDCVGSFSFESLAGGKVANATDPAKPGRAHDGPQLVEGRVGRAIRLSGENNVSFPGVADFTRNDPFTIALWLRTPDHKKRAVIFHRSRAWTDAGSRGYQLLLEDGRPSWSLIHFWPGNAIRIRARERLVPGGWTHVAVTYDGSSRARGLAIYIDGRRAACEVVRDGLRKNITGGGKLALTIGQRFRDRGFKDGLVDELRVFARCLVPLEVAQLHDGRALAAALARRDPCLFDYWRENHDSLWRDKRAALRELRRGRSDIVDPISEIMVMRAFAPRSTWVRIRGAYDRRGERVAAGTPPALPAFPRDAPRNRLGLARWLTDPAHPLTARVTVNRLWQAVFGRGLVVTSEDFGTQGRRPSHPALLDWLARQLVRSGWDIKALLEKIVTSSTFRQSSVSSPALMRLDPENRWLARGPSYRLPAEMVRDAALHAGGLLVEKLGGPPVKPYQPAGLWREKSGRVYRQDKGEGLYRRSLYTYWKRTSPPPAMMILDAAKRDVCVARRQRTATPLQALLLMNDPQFVEAARSLAERILQSAAPGRLRRLFRTVLGRAPEARERAVLAHALDEQHAIFRARPAAAAALLEVGERGLEPALDPVVLAAWSVVASMLLNHDEFVMLR